MKTTDCSQSDANKLLNFHKEKGFYKHIRKKGKTSKANSANYFRWLGAEVEDCSRVWDLVVIRLLISLKDINLLSFCLFDIII